jgi:hypothetical protein
LLLGLRKPLASSKPEADKRPCGHCHKMIYTCVTPTEHQAYCDGCGELYYTCDKTDVKESEEPRYRHQIVGKGTPDEHYACKHEGALSIPIPDK